MTIVSCLTKLSNPTVALSSSTGVSSNNGIEVGSGENSVAWNRWDGGGGGGRWDGGGGRWNGGGGGGGRWDGGGGGSSWRWRRW
ncbi:hypothetical protein RB653_000094 [Dictyostelium firmibasis]|uniref:Uncharacterized protein n=1 Tax=Dictyostelium firmibasis TaxID=79012 RepID=A0AAN7YU28_9MYCE